MFDNPTILNLHLLLRVSYIADWMSSRHIAAEDRREAAVTHLALARRQNCRKRHFGFFKRQHDRSTKDHKVQRIVFL